MQKIDRLGWADGLCFTAYGVNFGVRVNDPTALDRVQTCLPPGWQPAESPFVQNLYSLRVGGARPGSRTNNFHLLYFGLTQLARTMEREEVFDALEGHLHLTVAATARERVFVHAGVVGWNGRAIVIPGRSHSGKSTLVAALVRAGATYYSDEYAVLDANGHVHPFARPLSLRYPPLVRPRRCTAEELGGHNGVEAIPVGLVALTRYQPGAEWQPKPISAGPAVLGMLRHTVPIRHRPEAALATLREMTPRCLTLKGIRGDAGTVVGPLLEQVNVIVGQPFQADG